MLDEKCKSNLSSQSANNFFFQFWQEFAKTLFLVYSGPTFVVKNRLDDVFLVDDGPVVLGWVGSWSRPSCSPGCQVAEPRPQAIQATCSLFIPPPPRPPHLINMAMDTKRAIIIQWPWLEIREILCKKLLKKIWQAGNERSGWPSGP